MCSILLLTQRTAESLLLQLLTAGHSRAGPGQFGALGEIRSRGPQTATASVNHHYMLSVGVCYKIFLGCVLSYLASEMCAPHSQKKYVLGRTSRNLDGASRKRNVTLDLVEKRSE